MSTPQTRATLLGVLAFVLLSTSPIASAAERPKSCRIAKALRVRGYLDEALKQAQGAVGDAKTRQCALEELTLVRSTRAARAKRVAQRLRDAGLDPSAVTALEARLATGDAPAIQSVLRSLETTSSLAVPRALILAGFTEAGTDSLSDELKKSKSGSPTAAAKELLTTLATRRIQVAKALENAGQHDAALEEVKAAVRADPKIAVPRELRPGDSRLPWWRGVLGGLGPWVRSLAEAMIVALGALLLLLALGRLYLRFVKRRLELAEITGDGSAEVGQGLREQFGRLKNHNGGASLEHVSASGTVYDIPAEVSKAFPQVGIVIAALGALNRLIPARRWRVGALAGRGGPNHGPVLTMSIARRDGRVLFAETLRLSDYRWQMPADGTPTSADWQRLGLPAAVWLMFHAGRPGSARYTSFTALGTDNWRSYALFAAGASVAAQVENTAQRHFARRLYLDALEADARNQGAALNLARVEMIEATTLNDPVVKARLYAQARARLAALRAQLEKTGSFHDDLLWYRVRYMEMSAQIPPAGPSPSKAYEAGNDLVMATLERLDKVDSQWKRGHRSRGLRELLIPNEGASIAALASASKEAGGTPSAYDNPPATRKALLEELEATPEGQRYDPARLAAYAENRCVEHASTRYNLACYYIRVGDDSEAKDQLRSAIALGGPSFGAQALIDPDLSDLGDELTTIVEEEKGPSIEPANGQ